MADEPALTGSPHRVLILGNPASGGHRQAHLDDIATALRRDGCDAWVQLSEAADDIRKFCADGSLLADTIAISGGDGTLNEAVGGLLERQEPLPALAIIPAGTGNVIANEFDMPRSAEAIATMITENRTQPYYIGRANHRPFLIMASVGFDADVVAANPAWLKRMSGRVSFALTTLVLSLRRSSSPLSIIADGVTISAKMAIVTNIKSYGSRFTICPQASAGRPDLFLLTMPCDDLMAIYRLGWHLLANTIRQADGVETRKVEKVEIVSDVPVACQIDGDPAGTTPVIIERTGRSFDMVVPG